VKLADSNGLHVTHCVTSDGVQSTVQVYGHRDGSLEPGAAVAQATALAVRLGRLGCCLAELPAM